MENPQVIWLLEKIFLDPASLQESRDALRNLNIPDDIKGVANLIISRKYTEVLGLKDLIDDSQLKATSPPLLTEQIYGILLSNDFSISSQVQVFCYGIANLQLFIESNWLGLRECETVENSINEAEAEKYLILDGESIFPTVKKFSHLLVAKCILHDLSDKFTCFKLSQWWLLRYLYIHQRVLEEPSQLLNNTYQKEIELSNFGDQLADDSTLAALLLMEKAYFHMLYGEVQRAKDCLEKARETVDFNVDWHGALGKRTRFQQKAVAQLTLQVHSSQTVPTELERLDTVSLPKDVLLEDDTRLNEIVFVDGTSTLPDLPPLHQALLISLATQLEKYAMDEIMREQLAPLYNCVIAKPKVWSLHLTALMLRSKYEADKGRTVERSMIQMQELVDSLRRPSPPADVRAEYFYVSRMPLELELNGMLADLELSLGAVNSALDIYLRLQMWDKVILCYQLLEMKYKAEEIVRQELAKQATPKLWCLLGDCTNDVQCYEMAWNLSKETSARAKRDWAYHLYKKKQFRECIPHYQQSLAINSLQEGVWLRLGFAASEIEDWNTAASAYRRYCSLNAESFEAWNNLARCYIRLQQKNRAWKALQEAIKCNYDNWMVWDNAMVVSIDCGEFEEVIKAYNRILDLKEKHVDVEVLTILVQAIVEERLDCHGLMVSRLGPATQKLLGRLTAQVPNNARVWEIYADLLSGGTSHEEVDRLFRVAQLLQKSYRSAVQQTGWDKDVATCCTAMQICIRFADACLACLGSLPASKETVHLCASAKLSLRSLVSQTRRCYDNHIPPEVDQLVRDLEQKLDSLTQTLSNSS